jgi:hypothetical protein
MHCSCLSFAAACTSGCMHGVCAGDVDFWYAQILLKFYYLILILTSNHLLQHLLRWFARIKFRPTHCASCHPVCLPTGWTGTACNTPTCKDGCDPNGGYCNVPGECLCSLGYTGPLCATRMCFVADPCLVLAHARLLQRDSS